MSAEPLTGLGGGVPEAAAPAAAPAPAALPCLNNNNSTNAPRRKYKFVKTYVGGDSQLSKDRDGRFWEQDPQHADPDKLFRYGRLNSAEAKAAYVLRGQVTDFFAYWGREHCAFFTITDEACRHPTEFNHCFDSWKTHHGDWMKGYIRVLEPQRRGAPHYHVLTAVEWDMQPDKFDWNAFFEAQHAFSGNDWPTFKACRDKYVASVPAQTREIWKLCRKTMPRYHMGRAEFLPIRKGEEAVSEYIGQYLEGGFQIRLHEWKGCRRIERDRRTAKLWNRHHRQFAWVSPGATIWRKRLGELATTLGITDYGQFSIHHGHKWCYRIRANICRTTDVKWNEDLKLLGEYLAKDKTHKTG